MPPQSVAKMLLLIHQNVNEKHSETVVALKNCLLLYLHSIKDQWGCGKTVMGTHPIHFYLLCQLSWDPQKKVKNKNPLKKKTE